ncbi:hypothetical protein, partial [Burkholderia cepacia]|uniref:hypothetical protein n=1 Tax=Burkholderia cepacia TaxID=292 RepID=UPI002FE39D71
RLPLILTSSVAINYGSKMSTKGWPVQCSLHGSCLDSLTFWQTVPVCVVLQSLALKNLLELGRNPVDQIRL